MSKRRTVPDTVRIGKQFLSATIKRDAVNIADRTVELSFSSEQPVERWWGIEILSHDPGDADLDWLSSGRAPYLVDHDTGQQIGVIESASIGSDKKGRALARFGTSSRAEQELQDCAAGIRVNVSVGYQITALTLVEMDGDPDGDGDSEPTYRAQWTPLEISNVAIPADMTVGIGREASAEAREIPVIKRKRQPERTHKMETEAEKAARLERESNERLERERTERTRVEITGATADAVKKERQRVADIQALAERHNKGPLGKEHVEKGTTIEEFRGIMLAAIEPGKALDTSVADLGMSDKDARQFSFLRAMRAQLGKGSEIRTIAPFEFEASAAIAQRLGRDPNGFFVPLDAQRQKFMNHNGGPMLVDVHGRALAVGTNTLGGYAVATDLMTDDFITLLRNRMMVRAMGATVLTGLVGNIAFPKQTAAASASWVAEANPPSESDQTLGQLTMSPKEIMGYTDYSRLLMQQSSIDVETFVRTDLAAIVALAVDLAALHGSGSSNQPLGVASTSGIGSVAGGTNGGAPTWADIVNLETAVAVANADVNALGYLSNAKTRGTLKQTLKNPAGTDATMIWPDVAGPAPGFGLVNGYKFGVSNQVSSTLTKGSANNCSAIFYGNWADLMIGEWGVLDLMVNPYTNATAGGIRVHVYQSVDIGVRRAASFAAMLDSLSG